MRAAPAAALVVLARAVPAGAAGFRSGGGEPGVLSDAPSTKARKLYVVSRDYPLEVVVRVQGWTKVRDAEGGINWIEDRLLTDRRTVMVKAARAEVRQAAEDNAPAAFVPEQRRSPEVAATSTLDNIDHRSPFRKVKTKGCRHRFSSAAL